MNAIDAVEELLAVGRRLQALARGLWQPVGTAGPFAVWDELAADPVARLAGLLAPYGRPVVAERSNLPDRSDPTDRSDRPDSFPWDYRAAPAHWTEATPPMPGRRPPSAGEFTAGAVPTNLRELAAQPYRPDLPRSAAADSVRLKRDPTSLLAILQSNLHPAGADDASAAANAGSGAMPAQASALRWPGEPSHMAAQVETVVSHPPPGADTPRARAVPSLTPDLGQAAAQRQVRNDQSTAGQALAPQSSFSVIADDLPRVTGFVGQGAGQVTANHGQVSGAGDGISPVDLWAAVPLPYANVTVWPSPQAPGNESEARQEPATAPAPLSAEQIDQILDALDERLELMLLRMYGTSTF